MSKVSVFYDTLFFTRTVFLYFANKKYASGTEKNEFFNSFIYRVVLFDDYVCIYYNTSPEYPTKVKLDKEELEALSVLREKDAENNADNKECTQFEPLEFKLGARGGVVRTKIEIF